MASSLAAAIQPGLFTLYPIETRTRVPRPTANSSNTFRPTRAPSYTHLHAVRRDGLPAPWPRPSNLVPLSYILSRHARACRDRPPTPQTLSVQPGFLHTHTCTRCAVTDCQHLGRGRGTWSRYPISYRDTHVARACRDRPPTPRTLSVQPGLVTLNPIEPSYTHLHAVRRDGLPAFRPTWLVTLYPIKPSFRID
jgi:hypothetical protein